MSFMTRSSAPRWASERQIKPRSERGRFPMMTALYDRVIMPMGAARKRMTVHPLDYASPGTKAGGRAAFRGGMIFCASAGLVANFGFVYLCVNDMYRASWVYHDLMQDPRAYGRVINPQIIASLRDPYALWISSGVIL